jgi:PilZ domain
MTTFNRRGSRTNVQQMASIKLGFFKSLACDVRDVSPSGARIVMPEGVDLPEQFVMRLPQFKRPRTCVRRWQSGQEVGVEFVAE